MFKVWIFLGIQNNEEISVVPHTYASCVVPRRPDEEKINFIDLV